MILKNLEWRREIDIESIYNWKPLPEYITEDLPFRLTGESKSGGPGEIDIDIIMNSPNNTTVFHAKQNLIQIHMSVLYSVFQVFWIPLGLWQARYWVDRGKKEEMIRYTFHILENLLCEVKRRGNKRATGIFGIEELTMYKVGTLDSMEITFT
jgi:hypothetical protein